MTITQCIEEIDNNLYGMIDECSQIPEDEKDEIKNKMYEAIDHQLLAITPLTIDWTHYGSL